MDRAVRMLLPHLSQLDWLWAEPTGVWNHVTPYYSIILQHIWWLFAWIKNPWLNSGLFNHHNAIWGKPESYHFMLGICSDSVGCRFYMFQLPAVCEESYGISEARSGDWKIAVPPWRPLPLLPAFRGIPGWPREIMGIGMWVLQKSKKEIRTLPCCLL